MKPRFSKRAYCWIFVGLISVLSLAYLLIIRWLKRSKGDVGSLQVEALEFGEAPSAMAGLTNAEAAQSQPEFDLDEEIKKEQRRFFRQAIRESLLSTFNADLFGIAIIMLLLDNPGGALGTMLILVLNLIINVFQEMFTKKRLDQILKELRPQASVIRESKIKSIEPAMIVEGDLLVVARGDEILVNGEIVGKGEITIEESRDDQDVQRTRLQTGDNVMAGAYCVDGRAVYRSNEDGIQHHGTAPGSRLQLLLGEKTSLQRFMEGVLRVLFIMVVIFSLLLVADAIYTGAELVSTEYRDAFSIIFGIAPTSLFFILIITYAIGTYRISERGALVFNSQTIETLASIKTLCISRESLISGLHVNLDLIEQTSGTEPLSESLVRRLLGDLFNSAPFYTDFGRMLAAALPGEKYSFQQVAPYLYEHGWYGIIFDEPELRGTFVIGLPEVLENNIDKSDRDLVLEVENTLTKARLDITSWWESIVHPKIDPDKTIDDYLDDSDSMQRRYSTSPTSEYQQNDNRMMDWRKRLSKRLDRLLSPMEETRGDNDKKVTSQVGIELLFTYIPEPRPLYNANGDVQLPMKLIPISRLEITEAVRSEAGETLQTLVEAGIRAILLSSDTPERSASTVRKLGLLEGELSMASGKDLIGLSSSAFTDLLRKTTIFGDLTPAQKADIVRHLRKEDGLVLMVGSQVGDVPAMQQADLRVALRSSTQAAMRLTDIVLLKDSLGALPQLVTTGQRLVNGVLDVFKLYLSQVISQLLLILAMIFLRLKEFPYHPTQAGVITAFTIAIPNTLLSVWAASGRITDQIIRRRLARFIIPTSVTFAILSLVAYWVFMIYTGDFKYTQLGVTFTLLLAGWMRVLFVQPPTKLWVGGAPLRGDRRVIGLVLVCALLFAIIISVPLFSELLHISWLSSPQDYLLTAVAALSWAVILRAIWRSRLLEPFFNWLTKNDP